MTTSSFTIPVQSFRHLETPFNKAGHRDYYAVIDVNHLPDLEDWRDINVRDPKLTGAVPQAITSGLQEQQDLFLFMNRGIVLSVDSVKFDNKSNNIVIKMTNPKVHGLLDGGHTYNIICRDRSDLEFPQFVKVEILEGFTNGDIPLLVGARNTSNQVKNQSLLNLRGEFDALQKTLLPKAYEKKIAYAEFEYDDAGNPKPIDIRDIVAAMTVFDAKNFNAQTHPTIAYSSKAQCLKHFEANTKEYRKIYPIVDDILRLYDTIRLKLPEIYNSTGGKFGHLTGVTTHKKNVIKLHFIGKDTKIGVPEGFVYPILGSFRALIEEKNGKYQWGKKVDPIKLLEGELGKTLANTIGKFALDARNPSKTGKSELVWQSCYQAAQVMYLTSKG